MDKIEPLPDHLFVSRHAIGDQVELWGKTYIVSSKTTLASGEPAFVLQGEGKQFVIGASHLIKGEKAS